ncbi:Flavoprotein NADH-dependent oxidoreductase (plasmid) [Acidisarcina polymorpha]|uniref:Flavoprotein NADH-dependent oxidoreductase n=1 Tax=Acidisarcina polymorpha TaxID=2211140 RepID=A0A2Z5GBU2_9BACT|nr:alkene reductase [Acidisarcina polymorpha]AXC16390.1 Flavoprotein NADH-dependent oxidoreductase [Acidisarcina polymorpha]
MLKSATDETSHEGSKGFLLQPILFGDLELRNRVVMAPLTRMRTPTPGAVPNDLMREYYEQRASAGLIISEGTFVSDQARGWFGAPGIYTEEQRKGWLTITDAVHRAGGHMIVQLWHQGSVSSRALVGHGYSPLGPSAVNPEQLVHTGYGNTEMTQVPTAMTLDDIRQTIADFRHASKVARDAGFDGVQIQGGFVYLFQQFMQENLNLRTDNYGGSIENRARLLFEALEAVLEVWPSSRVGVKAGTMMPERGGFRSSSSTLPTAEYVYRRLNDYDLSHVMLMRQLADLSDTPIEPLQRDGVLHHFRKLYSGTLILNVDISPKRGEQLLRDKLGEMIAFGREYIANPDLVERIRRSSKLNPQRPEGYYGATAAGYTDYPTIDEIETTQGEVQYARL